MMIKTNLTIDGVSVDSLKHGSDKKVVLVCDDCGRETTTTYHNYILGQMRNGSSGITRCRGCAAKLTGEAKRGKTIKRTKPSKTGSSHHSWNGGRNITSDGYRTVYLGPRTYRKEHLLVMEQLLGRSLTTNEIVHHIDGDKLNNHISNLILLPDGNTHQEVHLSLYQLGTELIRAGLIEFDKSTLQYKAHLKLRELLEQPEEANQQPSPDSDVSEGSTTRQRVS